MFKSIAKALIALTLITNLPLIQPALAKDSSDCYSISDSDNKNLCLGTAKKRQQLLLLHQQIRHQERLPRQGQR